MNQDKSCVFRKIYFYRIYAGGNSAGIPDSYDVKQALAAINTLRFEPKARYMHDEDGYEICCWVDDLKSPQKATFGKIKRGDLPQIEKRGELADLSLPEESGLAECAHVMFFPEIVRGIEYTIVSIEHNYEGPRVSRISDYLYEKSRSKYPKIPKFEPLLEQEVIEQLERMRIVRRFSLKVRDSLFRSSEQLDENLASALNASRQIGQPKEIELILSVGRGKGTLGRLPVNIAKKLVALRDTNYDVIKGEIKGSNERGDNELINLLNAKVVAEKWISRHTPPGVPRSERFYAAIEQAYYEKYEKLRKALGVVDIEA